MIAWSWECTPVVALAVWFPPLYSGRAGGSDSLPPSQHFSDRQRRAGSDVHLAPQPEFVTEIMRIRHGD